MSLPIKLTVAPPEDTTKLTIDPKLTDVPATGVELIKLPEGTEALEAAVTAPITRPMLVMAVVACTSVSPTMFGTATSSGPANTIRFTADPAFTTVPAVGF